MNISALASIAPVSHTVLQAATQAPESQGFTETSGAVLLVLTALAVLVVVVLWIATIVSIVRSSFSGGIKFLAIIASFAFPVISAIVWFAVGRRAQPAPGHRPSDA